MWNEGSPVIRQLLSETQTQGKSPELPQMVLTSWGPQSNYCNQLAESSPTTPKLRSFSPTTRPARPQRAYWHSRDSVRVIKVIT